MPDFFVADVNHFHPVRDFTAYARFSPAVILKATDGDEFVSSMFASMRAAAKAAGLRAIGFYHFWRDAPSPAAQADLFCRTIGTLGPNEWPILDVENVRWNDDHEEFCKIVDARLGRKTWAYAGMSVGDVRGRPLWVARYPRGDRERQPEKSRWGPGQPAFEPGQPGVGEVLWQFTDNAVGVPGLASGDNCDMSVFRGTADEFVARTGVTEDQEEDVVDDATIDKIARRTAQYVGGAPQVGGIPQTANLPGIFNDLRSFVAATGVKVTNAILQELRESSDSQRPIDPDTVADRVRLALEEELKRE